MRRSVLAILLAAVTAGAGLAQAFDQLRSMAGGGGSVPDVGEGRCVANCDVPDYPTGGGGGSSGGYDPGYQAAMQGAHALGSALGNMLATMIFGNPEADRAAAEAARAEAERQRVVELQRRQAAVAAWEAERSQELARQRAVRQARRQRYLQDSSEALRDIEAMAQLGGSGDQAFDGTLSDLGELQVTERIGAFGTRELVPTDVLGPADGSGDGAVRLPEGATTPRLLRGSGTLYSDPDTPPRLTSDLPAQAEIRIESAAPGGPVGLHQGAPDAAPPPNPGAGPAPEAPAGESWGQRGIEVGLGAAKDGLSEAAAALARQTAAAARRQGRTLVPGTAAGLVGLLGEFGINLIEAGTRHQERRGDQLARAARELPAGWRRLDELRKSLKDPGLPAVDRDALEAEKARRTRELVEMTRLVEEERAKDTATSVFDATFNRRSLLEATAVTAFGVLEPAKRVGDFATGKLLGKGSRLLETEAFQVAKGAKRQLGGAVREAVGRIPGVPVQAARKGLGKAAESALTAPLKGALEKGSGYKGVQEKGRDALGSWAEDDDLAPKR